MTLHGQQRKLKARIGVHGLRNLFRLIRVCHDLARFCLRLGPDKSQGQCAHRFARYLELHADMFSQLITSLLFGGGQTGDNAFDGIDQFLFGCHKVRLDSWVKSSHGAGKLTGLMALVVVLIPMMVRCVLVAFRMEPHGPKIAVRFPYANTVLFAYLNTLATIPTAVLLTGGDGAFVTDEAH